MKTEQSPFQSLVFAMRATGMTCQAIANRLQRTLGSTQRALAVAKRKNRVKMGDEPNVPRFNGVGKGRTNTHELFETRDENKARIAMDIHSGLRCGQCFVVLKGSDCEEKGSCAARRHDLLHGEAITRIGRLWDCVKEGKNQRE